MTIEEHERELELASAGRTIRRQLKVERHAASARAAIQPGPYETSYDTSRGYASDRAIDLP